MQNIFKKPEATPAPHKVRQGSLAEFAQTGWEGRVLGLRAVPGAGRDPAGRVIPGKVALEALARAAGQRCIHNALGLGFTERSQTAFEDAAVV